ncbi:MAG: hypothetical protein P1U63_09080 [Coxiellaceae bacterium]|nr:hypothetical protein [Coxiellaceae bacterium]
MPHTSIMYSTHFADFDFKPLLAAISQAYVTHCKAQISTALGYATPFTQVVVAGEADSDKAIIWIRLKMKAGRNQEQKNALMLEVRDLCEQLLRPFARTNDLFCQPRVELSELSADYMMLE